MKILMLTPYLPFPPASGGQIRTLNLLKYLKNHEVTLVCLYKSESEKQYAKQLEQYCKKIIICKRAEGPWQIKNIAKSIFTFLPFLIVRNYSSEAKNAIHQLLQTDQFDVIHAETFYIMPHIPKTNIPILLVDQTIEFKVYQHFVSRFIEHFSFKIPSYEHVPFSRRVKQLSLIIFFTLFQFFIKHTPFLIRLALSIDILKLRYWETYYWRQASVVATVSPSDQKVIAELAPATKTTIIPNGAGDEMFVSQLSAKDVKQPKLLFVGNFYWLQNTEAALYLINDIAPLIKAAIPNVEIIIAGQDAKNKLSKVHDTSVRIITLPPNNTDLVRKLYQNATLFIAPIFGPGGTRLKILAAMASGLPVISTKVGVEGLRVIPDRDVCLAQTPEEFTKEIVSILNNPTKFQLIREHAYETAKSSYTWKNIAKSLESVYLEIMVSNDNRH